MDNELETRIRDCMRKKIPESELLNKKMDETYQEIRKENAGKRRKLSIAVKCSTAAAILLIALVYCVKNPALAAQLPLIGHIFSGLEDKVSYPGDYSKNSIKLPINKDIRKDTQAEIGTDTEKDAQTKAGTDTGKDAQTKARTDTGKDAQTEVGAHADKEIQADTGREEQPGAQAENKAHDAAAYQVQSGDITVTLSEVSYDQDAIYLAMLVQNEKGFAKNTLEKNKLGFESWVTAYKADGSKQEFNSPDGTCLAYDAEGEYIDSHTFKGIAQFQASNSDFKLSKYTECEITFTDFWQRLETGEIKTGNLPDTGEEVTWLDHDIVHHKGKWKFSLTVDVSKNQKQEITINDVNDEGYGMKKIIKTSYQMYAVPILPKGEKEYDYMITYWDADAKPLDSHGSDFNRASIYQRDISEVTVYLLRWEDFCESKGSNYYLQPEKAIYQTTVSFQN